MTPPTDPGPLPSEEPIAPSDRDALVDLLASCALDGVDADQRDLDAADVAGISADDVDRRRLEFAVVRDDLLGVPGSTGPEFDLQDEVSERRRERSIAAAVAASARPPKQRLDAPVPAARTTRRRLAPMVVAAGILAVAGLGAFVVFDGNDTEDTASSGAEVQLDAATDASRGVTTDPVPPTAGSEADITDAAAEDAFDTDETTVARSAAPSVTVLDLGSLDSLNLAFDSIESAVATGSDGFGKEAGADTSCVVQMAIEGYRAVATARVGTTTHLLGESGDGELAAFRTTDCTVVARRPG